MKRKPAAIRNIGINLNRRAIDAFRCDCPVELRHGCALAFLKTFPFQGREPVYCDPPYAQSTRRSQHRCRFDCTDDDHVELLGILKSLPYQVMGNGYLCPPFYDTHLAGWRLVEIQVNNQFCVVTGKLWFNFAQGRPCRHICAGRNFTDCQRIKRNAAAAIAAEVE